MAPIAVVPITTERPQGDLMDRALQKSPSDPPKLGPCLAVLGSLGVFVSPLLLALASWHHEKCEMAQSV